MEEIITTIAQFAFLFETFQLRKILGSKSKKVVITPRMKAKKSHTTSGPSKVNSGKPGNNFKITGSVLFIANNNTTEKIIALIIQRNKFIIKLDC